MNDVFLPDGRDWLVGDHVSLADFAILPTVLYLEQMRYNLEAWSRIVTWLTRCKNLPYFDECTKKFYAFKLALTFDTHM